MTRERKENSEWLAGYIYYGEPLDKVIVEAVIPFVEQVMAYDWIDSFFFIRYWERGPHIRLRFLGDPEKLESELKPAYLKHFGAYFEAHPSERKEPEYAPDTPEDLKWFPNNSVQFITYEPETERYGGEHCLVISEEHFMFSSQSIFDLMTESAEDWGYDRAMGAAIQMHLSMAFGLGMDDREMVGFFDEYYNRWLHRAYYFFEPNITKEELEKRKESTLEAFDQTYEAQRESLVSFFEQILELLKEGGFEDTWLETWVDGAGRTRAKLDDLMDRGLYDTTKFYEMKEEGGFSIDQQKRWALFDSYVHMTNNRVGILNRDEAYLAFIISKTLKLYKKDQEVHG